MSQNIGNSRLRPNSKSGYKGVFWDNFRNGWNACISKDRKRYNLGVYVNIEDAARAYDAAAKKLYGEFAMTNMMEKRHA